MTKGISTKENIIQAAFDFTSRFGLESLSIGELAKLVGMSKSGLFGHFNSKEALQMKVLDFAAQSFIRSVVRPALKSPRGKERILALSLNWQKWASSKLAGGCPIIAATVEYDDRPGKIRDYLQLLQGEMMNTFSKAAKIAIDEGEFDKNLDTEQFAYEFYANMMAFHVFTRLLRDRTAKQKYQHTLDQLISRASIS